MQMCKYIYTHTHPHSKLFAELLKRDMPVTFKATFIHAYHRQSLPVKWETTLSSDFIVWNGVKQGGVLSPILFAIYVQMDCWNG